MKQICDCFMNKHPNESFEKNEEWHFAGVLVWVAFGTSILWKDFAKLCVSTG